MRKKSLLIAAFAFVTAFSTPPGFAREIHDTGSFAKCMAEGNQCLAEGKPKAECERVVESCLDAADNKEREGQLFPDISDMPAIPYSPRALRESCVALIDGCFARTLALETCVVDMYRCPEDRSSENCCPKRCMDKFKELTAGGVSDFAAYSSVFKHDAYSCFGRP
jgi:hypothetical protein